MFLVAASAFVIFMILTSIYCGAMAVLLVSSGWEKRYILDIIIIIMLILVSVNYLRASIEEKIKSEVTEHECIRQYEDPNCR